MDDWLESERDAILAMIGGAEEHAAFVIGNAVYVEHVGGCGDIFAWGARDKDAAEAIAGELNAVLNGLRAALADSAKKAGEYAAEVSRRLADVTAERDRLREGIMRPKPEDRKSVV